MRISTHQQLMQTVDRGLYHAWISMFLVEPAIKKFVTGAEVDRSTVVSFVEFVEILEKGESVNPPSPVPDDMRQHVQLQSRHYGKRFYDEVMPYIEKAYSLGLYPKYTSYETAQGLYQKLTQYSYRTLTEKAGYPTHTPFNKFV